MSLVVLVGDIAEFDDLSLYPATSLVSVISDVRLQSVETSTEPLLFLYSIVQRFVVARFSWQLTDWVVSHWDPYTVLSLYRGGCLESVLRHGGVVTVVLKSKETVL